MFRVVTEMPAIPTLSIVDSHPRLESRMLLRLRMVEETENDPAETWKGVSRAAFSQHPGRTGSQDNMPTMVVRSASFVIDLIKHLLLSTLFSLQTLSSPGGISTSLDCRFPFQLAATTVLGATLANRS